MNRAHRFSTFFLLKKGLTVLDLSLSETTQKWPFLNTCPFTHVVFLKASTQRWSCWAAGRVWTRSFTGCYHTALQRNCTKKIFPPSVYQNANHSTSLPSINSGRFFHFCLSDGCEMVSRFNLFSWFPGRQKNILSSLLARYSSLWIANFSICLLIAL